MKEAGAVLAGGHSINDEEPKYGMSVTGFVHPDKIWKNTGAQPGDLLILTKALGVGILNTAVKAEMASPKEKKAAQESMTYLNKTAMEVFRRFPIHCCTDVTGFSLGGTCAGDRKSQPGKPGNLYRETSSSDRRPGLCLYGACAGGYLPE